MTGPQDGAEDGPAPEPEPGPGRVRDQGLQPERTRLAWRRTTLTCTVVAVLAARQGVEYEGGAGGVLATAFSALAWSGFLVVANRRIRVMGGTRPPAALSVGGALAAAVCALALAAFAVATVG
jgi:hypothetical protein